MQNGPFLTCFVNWQVNGLTTKSLNSNLLRVAQVICNVFPTTISGGPRGQNRGALRLPAVGQLNIGSLAKPGSWDRTHLSVVTRVGVIVAVAIVCVIVAVLTSAYRADEVALEQERQLFTPRHRRPRRARVARSGKRHRHRPRRP